MKILHLWMKATYLAQLYISKFLVILDMVRVRKIAGCYGNPVSMVTGNISDADHIQNQP